MVLPKNFLLRPATARDANSIRFLVLRAKLDPTQLRWRQFWVIEHQGQLVACGQLRNFFQSQELGSLVVAAPWRNQGLGTYLARHLIREASKPLYLECLGKELQVFYSRLGFVVTEWRDLPSEMKRKFALPQLVKKIFPLPVEIMRYSRKKI